MYSNRSVFTKANRYLMLLAICLSFEALAGFHIVNKTNKPILVGLVHTFLHKDAYVYSKGWYTVDPGQTFNLEDGGFNSTRKYWLHIEQVGTGRTFSGVDFDFKNPDGTVSAYMRKRTVFFPYDSRQWQKENRFVAQEMEKGNWEPFKSIAPIPQNVWRRYDDGIFLAPTGFRTEQNEGGELTIFENGSMSLRKW